MPTGEGLIYCLRLERIAALLSARHETVPVVVVMELDGGIVAFFHQLVTVLVPGSSLPLLFLCLLDLISVHSSVILGTCQLNSSSLLVLASRLAQIATME